MSLSEKLTNLMNSIRGLSNASDKLSLDDATNLLIAYKALKGDPFTIQISKFQAYDANAIPGSGIFWISTGTINGNSVDIGKGNDGVKYHYPINGQWWYLINLKDNFTNAFQIAITQAGTHIYMRSYQAGAWQGWNKLGGVVKAVLSALTPMKVGCAS